jgi:hypothetical protein
MIKIGDYETIMNDRNIFNQIVYTPLSEAIKILDERKKDKNLVKKIEDILHGDIPEPLKTGDRHGVQFRQIATPNNDVRWFTELTKDHGLLSVFFEYHDDKFTSNNDFKHALGQLRVHDKINRKGEHIEEKITILDFNKYNGKPLKDVLTNWNEPLVDFHRKLFDVFGYSKVNMSFYDASTWFKNNGEHAIDYYTNFILLFICHGILFENFLLSSDSEGDFTKNIFLPAFEKVINLTGIKPLIVPIPPMDNQMDSHWIAYGPEIKKAIPTNHT